MTKSYEEQIIEFEDARNKEMKRYFLARPKLNRTIHNEKLFEAGFRMAWDLLKEKIELSMPAIRMPSGY